MAGSPLQITARDRAVLRALSTFGVLTRTQVIRLGHFRSKTRANARLKRLTDAGYLTARVQPLTAGGPALVYGPGPALDRSRHRRRRVSEGSALFLTHELGLVDLRIAFGQHTDLRRWLTASDLTTHGLGLIPDAYVEYAIEGRVFAAFLEYDRGTESLGRLEQKIRAYLDLAFSGRFAQTFQHRFFRALFVADTAGRAATLHHTATRLTDKVIRVATRTDVIDHGPLAAIWRRPGIDHPEPLIESA